VCGRARARLFTHGHSASEVVLSGFRSASKARVLGYGIALTTAQATQEKRSRSWQRRLLIPKDRDEVNTMLISKDRDEVHTREVESVIGSGDT
jgi:hypothetical protein